MGGSVFPVFASGRISLAMIVPFAQEMTGNQFYHGFSD
jgi:hypothetical protein